MADNTRNPSLLGGDHQPADAGDGALLPELPKQYDLSWPERGWLSALGVPLEGTPPTDPAGGELAVGLTGDMYYILPGSPGKLDDTRAEQLLEFLTMPVPDDQDAVAGSAKHKGNGDTASPLLDAHQEKESEKLM